MSDEKPVDFNTAFGNYQEAVRDRKRRAVRRVLFPKMELMSEQSALKQSQAYNKSLNPLLKTLLDQQKLIQGSGEEAAKQRGATVRSLIQGMIRDINNQRTVAQGDRKAKLDYAKAQLSARLRARDIAERLSRPPSTSGSASTQIGLTDEKLRALATKTYGQITSTTDVQDAYAKAFVVGSKVPRFQRDQFVNYMGTMANQAPATRSSDDQDAVSQFEEGFQTALSEIESTGTVTVGGETQRVGDVDIGIFKSEFVEDPDGTPAHAEYVVDPTYGTVDEYGIDSAIESDSTLTPEQIQERTQNIPDPELRAAVRKELYMDFHPNMLDDIIEKEHHKAMSGAHYMKDDAFNMTLDRMIAALMSGDEGNTKQFLDDFYGASGLTEQQKGALDYNQSYQQMLLDRMQDPNAGSSVRAARDVVINSPQYKAFKESKGYMTDWAALKDLARIQRGRARTNTQHDRLLLRASKKGLDPRSFKAFEALQNRVRTEPEFDKTREENPSADLNSTQTPTDTSIEIGERHDQTKNYPLPGDYQEYKLRERKPKPETKRWWDKREYNIDSDWEGDEK